jgi:hypothetical protein
MPCMLRGYESAHGPQWYEEDCDAALIVLAFPKAFYKEMRIDAVNRILILYRGVTRIP